MESWLSMTLPSLLNVRSTMAQHPVQLQHKQQLRIPVHRRQQHRILVHRRRQHLTLAHRPHQRRPHFHQVGNLGDRNRKLDECDWYLECDGYCQNDGVCRPATTIDGSPTCE